MKVAAERCNQCLFGPNKIVSERRQREVLRQCERQDAHFVCHKASNSDQGVCCRGFYDTRTSNLIRIMQRLNGIEFVKVE